MTFRRTHGGVFVALVLCVGLVACGGNSNNPSSGNTCSSVSVLGSAKGLINATINGATFKGGVPAAYATYFPIAAVPSIGFPAQDFIQIQGLCGDNTSLLILARAILGTTNMGTGGTDPLIPGQPLVNNAILQYRTTVAAGTWNISTFLGGSGSITLTSVSPTAASGSFSFTMVPQAGTPTSGNRQVVGTFSVTF